MHDSMTADYVEGVRDAMACIRARRACYPQTSEVYSVLTRLLNDLIRTQDSQK